MQNSAKNTSSNDEEKNKKINPNDFNPDDSFTGEEKDDSDVEDDGTPVLDEEDLEENNIDDDESEDIDWEPPKKE
ncbi:MAG TPA: hypothetical protein VGW31_00650 [Hanamia sp.]|nr:hypothetical protein [Hanamia sp.]